MSSAQTGKIGRASRILVAAAIALLLAAAVGFSQPQAQGQTRSNEASPGGDPSRSLTLAPQDDEISDLRILNEGGVVERGGEMLVEFTMTSSFSASSLKFYMSREDEKGIVYEWAQTNHAGSSVSYDEMGYGDWFGPWNNEQVRAQAASPVLPAGTYVFDIAVPLSMKPGPWFVCMVSNEGFFKYYYDEKGTVPEGSFTLVDPGIDFTAPTASIIYPYSGMADRTKVQQGSIIEMRLLCMEEGSGLATVYMHTRSLEGDDFVETEVECNGGPCPSVGLLIPEGMRTGTWIVDRIVLTDLEGNSSTYEAAEVAGEARSVLRRVGRDYCTAAYCPQFTVVATSGGGDKTAPYISSFRFLNDHSIVNHPGILRIEMGIVEEGSGVTSVKITDSVFTHVYGPGETELDENGCAVPWSTLHTGKRVFCFSYPENTWPGITGVTVTLTDAAGNTSTFTPCDEVYTRGIDYTRMARWHTSRGDFERISGLPSFVVMDEFDFLFEALTSECDVVSLIEDMPDDGCAHIIPIGGTLRAEVLEAIRGTRKTLVCTNSSPVTWIFHGEDVTGPTWDIDMGAYFRTVPAEELAGAEQDAVLMDFSHEGALPCKAEMRFRLNKTEDDYGVPIGFDLEKARVYGIDETHFTRESGLVSTFNGTETWYSRIASSCVDLLISPDVLKGLSLGQMQVELARDLHFYDGMVWRPKVKSVWTNRGVLPASRYTVKYATPKSRLPGVYKITVTAKGKYVGEASVNYFIICNNNKVKIAGGKTEISKKIAASKLRSSARKIILPKATATFGTPVWEVAKADKRGVLSLRGGKVVVKRGAARGTYAMKVVAAAYADHVYATKSKTVTVKVTVT